MEGEGIGAHINAGNGQGENVSYVRDTNIYLPMTNVLKIVRRSLPPNRRITDDSKETMQVYVTKFIKHITKKANEKCYSETRVIVSSEDIISALRQLGFNDYIGPLTLYLNKLRESNTTGGTLAFDLPGTSRGVTTGPPPPTGYAPPYMNENDKCNRCGNGAEGCSCYIQFGPHGQS